MGEGRYNGCKNKGQYRIINDFLEIYEYLIADKVILKITIGYSRFSSDSEPEQL